MNQLTFFLYNLSQIPADGLVFASHNMKVDESSMTGESDAIKKNDVRPRASYTCHNTSLTPTGTVPFAERAFPDLWHACH